MKYTGYPTTGRILGENQLSNCARDYFVLHYIAINDEIQRFLIGRLEDLPGEFCGEEAGEQRGEKLKPG